MRLRSFAGIPLVGAFLAPLLAASTAAAQYPPPPPPPGYYRAPADGPRFRGGVSLEGGVFIAPSIINIGSIGVAGTLGVQINNNWAVYGVPTLDIMFGGGEAGAAVLFAVLGEYTFDNVPISLGAGFEGADFFAIGQTAVAGGVFYGGRLHFAYYPVMVRSDFNPLRRKALAVGLDLHLDGDSWGGGAACNLATGVCSASTGGFLFSPMLFIGYQAM
jgi:hypothetical protein